MGIVIFIMAISNRQIEEIYSVSELNREVRYLLEGSFATVWVEGEISNFIIPSSGHWYFSLKDANAQVRCAMFKMNNRNISFQVKDGMHVLIKARVSLYEGRGDFQLIAEHLEEAGEGKLRKAFEELKKRLSEAGLFDTSHKKSLPMFPQCIGIITSSTGAAIRDILHILKRRFSCVPIIIYPTLVQGELAAANIVDAIRKATLRKECDVLILARGGGSLEDLWPFNEEIVARAIYKSEIPIITGIGHEIDFTIADFVADVRAPTPSAAAEIATPDKQELLNILLQLLQQFIRIIKQQIKHFQQTITWTIKHLHQQHPKRKLKERSQLLDLMEAELIRVQTKLIHQHDVHLHRLKSNFLQLNPLHLIREMKNQWALKYEFIKNFMMTTTTLYEQRMVALAAKLDTLSPLATLKRGYAIATGQKDNRVLHETKRVTIGDTIQIRLQDGRLVCDVKDIISYEKNKQN